MGFNPRQWSPSSSARDDRNRQNHAERVSSNVEALLRENDALRREVQRLHQQLDRLHRQQWQRSQRDADRDWNRQQPSTLVNSAQVQRWGDSLAMQPGWSALRQHGLEQLIDQLNRSSFHSQLSLSQRLDRVVSGLGTDLLAAVGASPRRKPQRCWRRLRCMGCGPVSGLMRIHAGWWRNSVTVIGSVKIIARPAAAVGGRAVINERRTESQASRGAVDQVMRVPKRCRFSG